MQKKWGVSLLLLVVGICLTQENARAGEFDWPQWRGPNRDAVSRETGLLKSWPQDGPPVLWNSRDVNNGKGIGRGYSSVSVADGRIFTMGDSKGDCYVFALEEETGKELWATRISPGERDGPRCTPTVDGDRVYALSRQGILVCLLVKDGKLLWQLDFKGDLGGQMMSRWDYSESPLVDGDRLICTPGADEAALVALDKMTGKLVWKAEVPKCGGAGYASIVTANVGGIKQYITFFKRYIVGVRAQDGKLLWKYGQVTNGTANIPTPIVWDDLVFCSTAYRTGAALLKLVPDGKGGVDAKEVYFLDWQKLQNHHGGMVRVGEYVYGGHGHNEGNPFCLHLKSGKFAWGPLEGPGTGSAAVVYADGHLYFRYQDGVVALIEATPEKFHVKSLFSLPRKTGRPSWPHPVIANGRLYIRGNDMLIAYDVKQK